MANKVRVRESLIMEAIYAYNPYFNARVINTYEQLPHDRSVLMEGGDILVVRDDILVIGNGMRTTSQGIDLLLNRLAKTAPQERVQFCTATSVFSGKFYSSGYGFTMLDVDKCMVLNLLYWEMHVTVRYRSHWTTEKWRKSDGYPIY